MKTLKNYINENLNESRTADLFQTFVELIPYRAPKAKQNIKDFDAALTDEVIKNIHDEIKKEFKQDMKDDQIKELAHTIFDDWSDMFEEE